MANKKMNKMAASSSRSSGMLSENRSAVANMPQDVKYHAWPLPDVGLDARVDDTITKIDKQMGDDMSAARRAMNPTSY